MNQGPETLLVDLNLSRCRQDISTTIYAAKSESAIQVLCSAPAHAN